MHAFERWMHVHFGATPPVGHRLRTDHAERWLRLHSLPDSKRYAETDAEREEIRRRARAIASELFRAGGVVWLVARTSGDDESPPRLDSFPGAAFERVEFVGSADDEPIGAYVSRTTWPHAGFDSLVDAVADGGPIRAVWFCETNGEAFAPYDGGFDLVVRSPEHVERLRRTYPPDWRSARGDGL